MKKRLVVTILLLLLGLITTRILTFAGTVEEKHKPILTEPVEHYELQAVVSTPKMYYFYWLVLGVTLLIVVGYFYKIQRGPLHQETQILALILIILGISLYFIDQLPSVAGYHEPTVLGLIKFIYRIILGILFMVYAYLGMEHHNLHK